MTSKIKAVRYHDISCGHRVAGHEGKCRNLHGHNYRITFEIESKDGLDEVGRVLDFSVIKQHLCIWLEKHWDHRFLCWQKDAAMHHVLNRISDSPDLVVSMVHESIVWTPFNPTAENMGKHLLTVVGPSLLSGTGCVLTKVIVEETRKCSAEVSL